MLSSTLSSLDYPHSRHIGVRMAEGGNQEGNVGSFNTREQMEEVDDIKDEIKEGIDKTNETYDITTSIIVEIISKVIESVLGLRAK